MESCQAFMSDPTLGAVGIKLLAYELVFEAVQQDPPFVREWTADDIEQSIWCRGARNNILWFCLGVYTSFWILLFEDVWLANVYAFLFGIVIKTYFSFYFYLNLNIKLWKCLLFLIMISVYLMPCECSIMLVLRNDSHKDPAWYPMWFWGPGNPHIVESCGKMYVKNYK